MKILITPLAAVLVPLALLSCGGEPLDYDSKVASSVFVWRDDAFAEHPAVVHENDPGMPDSTRKALIGKTLSVDFTTGGVAYQLIVEFQSQTRCVVRTDVRVVADGVMTAFPGTYVYKIDNTAGTEATLTLSFDDNNFWSNTCVLKLVFQSAVNSSPTTFTQFRNSGNETIVPVGTQATTSTWALTGAI